MRWTGAKSVQMHQKNKADKIEKFLNESTPKKKSRNGEAQSNITDNESAKMKSSHGVIQGYNGMAIIEMKYIDIFNCRFILFLQAQQSVLCCVREKTRLALAMKELAQHIEPKRRLNVAYTRHVTWNFLPHSVFKAK